MKVVCTHCGLPFSVARAEPGRPVFCCSGCALAFRVASAPSPSGEAPPAPLLLGGIGVAFLFFNQALAAMLARLVADGRGFAAASLGAGLLAWGALVVFLRQGGAWRGADRAAAAVLLAGIGGAAILWRPDFSLACNALLIAWSLRGLARKKFSRGKVILPGREG